MNTKVKGFTKLNLIIDDLKEKLREETRGLNDLSKQVKDIKDVRSKFLEDMKKLTPPEPGTTISSQQYLSMEKMRTQYTEVLAQAEKQIEMLEYSLSLQKRACAGLYAKIKALESVVAKKQKALRAKEDRAEQAVCETMHNAKLALSQVS